MIEHFQRMKRMTIGESESKRRENYNNSKIPRYKWITSLVQPNKRKIPYHQIAERDGMWSEFSTEDEFRTIRCSHSFLSRMDTGQTKTGQLNRQETNIHHKAEAQIGGLVITEMSILSFACLLLTTRMCLKWFKGIKTGLYIDNLKHPIIGTVS